ncbi:NK-tumor recognition protein isoform X2 [Culex pipiens pallens]|uniref:NK-tumor recognition protein isoform X2 n=1 Tax=Culex pipiens pallens TaxID=42434 RepID=UPI0019534E60|nr:NK-tumor recognition protein isoform X2 [Culex pipiens pallens]
MESRFVNVSAVRTAPTSVHFVGARGSAGYAPILPKLAPERSIHSLQYSIPAVQHHYGNAFDDDDDGGFPIGGLNGYGQGSADGEYYNDEEDEEEVDEDVEMSPAIEVISIDPNCDYDSEEEDDDDEEEEQQQTVVMEQQQITTLQQEAHYPTPMVEVESILVASLPTPPPPPQQCEQHRVLSPEEPAQSIQEEEVIADLESDDIEPELQNLRRDSEGEESDNESTSGNESSRSGSKRSSCSSSSSNSSRSSSTSTASSHPSDYVPHSDQEEDADMGQAENLAQVIERRKLIAIERRKRTTSINRKSFSLPQSPVATGAASLMHEITSLSFEDLDVSAIVNDLSPLKTVVRASECDDKLVAELAQNNFDLAAYITEDDFGTTDSADSNANRDQKQQSAQKKSPVKKQPKSRGKQIKMLRELMISPKHDNTNDESGGVRRSCTNKAKRIVENSESESEESEAEGDSKVCGNIFGMERVISKPKRKEDDVKTDPTWNPNGAPSNKAVPNKMLPGLRGTGAPPASVLPPVVAKSEPKSSPPSTNPPETSKNSNSASTKSKPLSAGSQLARNKMLSLMAKNSPLVKAHKHRSQSRGSQPKLVDKKPDQQSKPKPVPASNIKLDHDYCSPKKAQKPPTVVVPQRKTIEIPFLLPTMDQLRKNKKLSKSKKELLKASRKTGENCDKKSQKIETVSNSGATGSVDHKPPAIVPVVVVKEEPADVKPLQVQVPTQQKQVSLLKINQNKPNGVQTIKTEDGQFALKLEPQPVNATSSCSNESMVKVKKKLNLEEYKKRRELPFDESICVSIPVTESSSKSSIGSVSTTSESSGRQEEVVSLKPTTAQCVQAQPAEVKPHAKVPLDPISAAKLKALRMQQLKREAAIKSNEAKIIPKTVPQIVPLAEITSMQFDEHGNPIPYDKNADNDGASTKLHADYEEIIIVSMGCNTEVTIHPREVVEEVAKVSRAVSQEQDSPKNGLLSDITATIKRCQSTVPTIISSSSLISSIKEVVIKKETTSKTEAAPTEKRAFGGGQANQQSSPNIGVSPNNAFSPGKPERAGGAYDEYEEGQLLQSSPEEKPSKPTEHGEDKIIMHLRKDRQRSKGVSIAIQTTPLSQFPDLKRLSPVKTKPRTTSRSSCGSATRSSQRSAEEDRSRTRRQYRKRHSRSSSSEAETRNRSSNSYSRSRCGSSRRRTRSRSRSYRGRSRSDSQRRRYQERDYSRRNRCSRRQRKSRSESSDYTSSSDSSCSRSRSRSSRSVSRPSSRLSPHPRNASRTEYRRPANVSPERKIVYVGRLEAALKRDDLKRKFMQYGRIKQVTLHYKESGAKYGFVTFEKPQDAYKAIDSSSGDPNLAEYDVSFGGRRAFCRTEYADLAFKRNSFPQKCVPLRNQVLKKRFLTQDCSLVAWDGDLSQNHEMPYFTPDGAVLMPPAPIAPMTRKDEGESFEDMLKKLKKEINSKKPRKT